MTYSKWTVVNSVALLLYAFTIVSLFFCWSGKNLDADDTFSYQLQNQPETEISISSNDFAVAHQSAKYEAVHQFLLNTLQSEKLIRASIFDFNIITFLTHILTLFTLSTYLIGLSPKWNPSIYIAQSRLVI